MKKENDILKDCLNIVDDLRVKDIVCYDFNELSPFYRYNIICTAGSDRQLNAVAKHLADYGFENKIDFKVEGKNKATWVLVDLKDVIVNVFTSDERENFALDKLYMAIPQVDVEQYIENV